ncbi:MAG: hypothetical protein AB3N14_15760 [Flavobacteriaceae bacterium]
MKILQNILLGLALLAGPEESSAQKNEVYVNGIRIGQATLDELAQLYRIAIQDGKYWYDNYNGAWGIEGGPTLGFALPYMNLGGKLQADASNGNTGVFVNGRELHAYDVAQLQQIMTVLPGRYWLDSHGYGGYEGGPAIFNLIQLAKQANKSTYYHNSYTDISAGSSGGTSYVMGKDFSVIVDN